MINFDENVTRWFTGEVAFKLLLFPLIYMTLTFVTLRINLWNFLKKSHIKLVQIPQNINHLDLKYFFYF